MIDGLIYIPNYVTAPEARKILNAVDASAWRDDFKRRVQHYGYLYDYKRRTVTREMYLGDLPDWSQGVSKQLHRDGHFDKSPDQLIVNEYLPAQGIAPHIDCEPCFGDTIASLSINSTCMMVFKHSESHQQVELFLEPNSLIVIKGQARYDWTHGIPARKTDRINDRTYARGRRISFTFRTVILD